MTAIEIAKAIYAGLKGLVPIFFAAFQDGADHAALEKQALELLAKGEIDLEVMKQEVSEQDAAIDRELADR